MMSLLYDSQVSNKVVHVVTLDRVDIIILIARRITV